MLNNVKDFGASGDGLTDDRAAIQAAIDDAVANNKGGILFSPGTYRVSRASRPGNRWSLDLNSVQDFTIMGLGPKSFVKLADTTGRTGDWHVFILRNNCRHIVFKDLVIDGNRAGLTDPDEQSHGIEVEDGTEDLVINGCVLRECFGDGVRLLGRAESGGGRNVKRVRIENCLFQSNKRSGLGIQRAIEQIIVANCIFDATASDQSIDFEPTGGDAPSDLVIQGCIINHTNRSAAVTLSGIGGRAPLLRCKFTDNLVLGGPIFCTDVDQLTIQNNVVVVPGGEAGNRIPVQIQRGGDSILITGNLLVNDNSATQAVITLSEVNHRQVTRAIIANNLCFTRSGRGIECRSGDDIAIQGNMIVATGPCTQGIFLDSESSNLDNVSVRDNDITTEGAGAWITGIQINATNAHQVHHVSVVGNSVRNATEGVKFQGSTFQRTPVCALNRIDAAVTLPIVGINVLPEKAVVVSGAASHGGATSGSGAGRFITGLGDPNRDPSDPSRQGVVGNVGDIFQRLDGGAGSTLYVKESDADPRTGWVSK